MLSVYIHGSRFGNNSVATSLRSTAYYAINIIKGRQKDANKTGMNKIVVWTCCEICLYIVAQQKPDKSMCTLSIQGEASYMLMSK